MISLFLPFMVAGSDYKIKGYREENREEQHYLKDQVRLTTYHNRGAFLNIGKKRPAIVCVCSVIFTIITGVIFIITLTCKGRGILKAGLGLLLGGAFSNTYDRIKKGYVVDYLNFPKAPGAIKNVIFNISDFAIIIGSAISVFHS